jgi:hypothetical protein
MGSREDDTECLELEEAEENADMDDYGYQPLRIVRETLKRSMDLQDRSMSDGSRGVCV